MKADYGRQLVEQLSKDLTVRFGMSFGRRNLFQIRAFYLAYPRIVQTASAQFNAPGGKPDQHTLEARAVVRATSKRRSGRT